MDTETVLKIIAMIDNAIDARSKHEDLDVYEYEFSMGYIKGLKELNDHLNIFIETQINHVENGLAGGE